VQQHLLIAEGQPTEEVCLEGTIEGLNWKLSSDLRAQQRRRIQSQLALKAYESKNRRLEAASQTSHEASEAAAFVDSNQCGCNMWDKARSSRARAPGLKRV
jgi:hypothetical protein